MKHTLIIAFLIAVSFCKVNAQGMAVNATGAAAAPSAILDVNSTTQGVLVPRMTSIQRIAIASPANGLLVYQTDATAGFYFYNGTAWASLNSTTTNTVTGNSLGNATNIGTAYSLSYSVLPTDGMITANCTLCNYTLPAANSVPPAHVIYIYNVNTVSPWLNYFNRSGSDNIYQMNTGTNPTATTSISTLNSYWVTVVSDGVSNWFVSGYNP